METSQLHFIHLGIFHLYNQHIDLIQNQIMWCIICLGFEIMTLQARCRKGLIVTLEVHLS